ncbi:MAG: DEAD/DEAH box helicase [Bacteroidia bacterium]
MQTKTASKQNQKKTKKKKANKENRETVSYHRKPEDLSHSEWQTALRKQFAVNNPFKIKNLDGHEVFSDFSVFNPATKNTYKVAIRGMEPGANFCSCYDFKTNQLGTCKHIEAVLFQLTATRRNREIFQMGFNPHYTSVYLFYGEERVVKIRVGSEESNAFKKLAKEYFDKNDCITQKGVEHFETFLEKAHQLHPDFRCYNDAFEFVLNMREQFNRHEYIAKRALDNIDNKYFDTLMKAKLFPYQKQGILFAAKAGRCLIADDMGLGKTIQAIGAAMLYKNEFNVQQVLIVCPTSLKYQWKSEIEKFTDATVAVIEGGQAKRMEQYKNDESFFKIITYNVVPNDMPYLRELEPDLVILDEAQRIKNWNAKISMQVKKIASRFAIVLTGTPLENKLEELYSIMQFVAPFHLGPLYEFLNSHQIKEANGKLIGYKDLNKIGERLRDVMLRRHKKEVLKQLPARMDKNLFVPMTLEQMDMHEGYKQEVARLILKWQRLGFLDEKDRQRLLINLNLMRMVCDSSYIVDQETRYDTKINEVMNILDEALASGDDKAVVFSQWERMTRLIAAELTERGIEFSYLHGGVESSRRKDLLHNFANRDSCKVFLSTDAGGVGLNLQSASLLINCDIPWNPAVLEQRIARIYRMGQKKQVNIINLVSKDTIEEKMLGLLAFKSGMAAGVLDAGESSVFLGESKFKQLMKTVGEMIEEPATVETPTESTPADEFEKVQQLELFENTVETNGSSYSGDDDVSNNNNNGHENGNGSATTQTSNANDVIQLGAAFFGKIAATLADPVATKQLVQSITEKDASGKSYLKIPVESENVVANMLQLIGGFFAGNAKMN